MTILHIGSCTTTPFRALALGIGADGEDVQRQAALLHPFGEGLRKQVQRRLLLLLGEGAVLGEDAFERRAGHGAR